MKRLLVLTVWACATFPAHAGNLFLACADVLPERREVFLQAAARTADVDHGSASEHVDKVTCKLAVSMARAHTVPMEPSAGQDSFMKSGTIKRAMQRSYPEKPK